MRVYLTDGMVEEFVKCKPNEWKVLLGMVKLARHNVVDLLRYYDRLQEICGLGDKSIETAITGLKKRGILVKTQLPRVWFIDPSYFMKGYYAKIFEISRMIAEQRSGKMLGKIAEWEEEEAIQLEKERLKSRWERKREEQKDFSVMEELVEDFTDTIRMSNDT